jgi:PHP family Zn ribbon phosphoesterase
MEITSKEEVHILALFDDVDRLFALQDIVQAQLPDTDDESMQEEQVIANENDEVLGFSSKLLIGTSGLSIERLVEFIHEYTGLAIAAHVDREAFGILGQLGFIPEGLPLDALEVRDVRHRESIPDVGSFAFITSSDAHSLSDIGSRSTLFRMEHPSIGEMQMCFRAEHGRSVRL